MKFTELSLAGVFLVEIEPHHDERGFFARTWCADEFAHHGIPAVMVQTSVSFNRVRGTLRGMHMQLPPSKEGKLVRCSRGRFVDVIIDMRPDSATFLRHAAVELDAQTKAALYIPPMFAHGFQTLESDTEVTYQMTDVFEPELAIGWRWDDPVFAIRWPIAENPTISPRDRTYPDFDLVAFQQKIDRA